MPIAIKLPDREPFWIETEIHTPSSIMDKLDGIDVDGVISYAKQEIELRLLRRVLVKFYNERGFKKMFTLKNCKFAYKIWRWQ